MYKNLRIEEIDKRSVREIVNFYRDIFANKKDLTDKFNLIELTILKLFEKEKIIPDGPINVLWSITEKCNFNCYHCWAKSRSSNVKRQFSQNELNLSEIKKIIDKLATNQVMHVSFSGGEPLIRKDLISILKYLKEYGIFFSILTNGSLLNSSRIRKISEIFDNRTDEFRISIDGMEDEHNSQRRNLSFQHIINNIKLLSESSINVSVNFTGTSININSLSKLFKFCANLGIKSLSASPVFPRGRGLDLTENLSTLEYLLEVAKTWELSKNLSTKFFPFLPIDLFNIIYNEIDEKDFPIATKNSILDNEGITTMKIDNFGNVFPGSRFSLSSMNSGNLIEKSFSEVWFHEKWNFIRKERNLTKTKCNHCKFLFVCRGGDFFLAYKKFGSIDFPDPSCNINFKGITDNEL